MLVKDLLKQDLPPTNSTARMRKEHTIGGVSHNLKHDIDHAKDAVISLEKLRTVDNNAAKVQAKRVLKVYQADVDKVKDLLRRWK